MPLRADSARVRSQILAAARRRVDDGDRELPMNTIAKDAGVGVGTVYRHFPSRPALLEALAEANLRALTQTATRAAADPEPGEGLRDFLKAALYHLAFDPALGEVLAAPDATCAETAQLRDELLTAAGTLLDRARAAGAMRPGVTANDLRALVCGVQHAARIAGAEQSGRYLEILVAGLRP